jgi:hypothetical protein
MIERAAALAQIRDLIEEGDYPKKVTNILQRGQYDLTMPVPITTSVEDDGLERVSVVVDEGIANLRLSSENPKEDSDYEDLANGLPGELFVASEAELESGSESEAESESVISPAPEPEASSQFQMPLPYYALNYLRIQTLAALYTYDPTIINMKTDEYGTLLDYAAGLFSFHGCVFLLSKGAELTNPVREILLTLLPNDETKEKLISILESQKPLAEIREEFLTALNIIDNLPKMISEVINIVIAEDPTNIDKDTLQYYLANLRRMNVSGKGVLHYFAANDSCLNVFEFFFKIIKCLNDRGIDISPDSYIFQSNSSGHNVLEVAALSGSLKIATRLMSELLLLDHPNFKTLQRGTCYIAASEKHVEVIIALANISPDPKLLTKVLNVYLTTDDDFEGFTKLLDCHKEQHAKIAAKEVKMLLKTATSLGCTKITLALLAELKSLVNTENYSQTFEQSFYKAAVQKHLGLTKALLDLGALDKHVENVLRIFIEREDVAAFSEILLHRRSSQNYQALLSSLPAIIDSDPKCSAATQIKLKQIVLKEQMGQALELAIPKSQDALALSSAIGQASSVPVDKAAIQAICFDDLLGKRTRDDNGDIAGNKQQRTR